MLHIIVTIFDLRNVDYELFMKLCLDHIFSLFFHVEYFSIVLPKKRVIDVL